jgi:hypothetical protein
MAGKNWFTVTVSRVGESANKEPYETVLGHTLTLSPDGSLSISGDGGQGFGITAVGYDGFEFKRLRVPRSGD